LKVSPEEAIIDNTHLDNKIKLENKLEDKKGIRFKIGDQVRVLLHRENFEKGTERKWSTDIYKVEKIELGNKHFVTDRKNYYKDYELLPISEIIKQRQDDKASEEQKVEKIERRVTKRMEKGVKSNTHIMTDEEKTERALRRRPRDMGAYYSYY